MPSVSQLRIARECPRKWFLEYELRLAPSEEPHYFAFGRAWNAALNGEPWELEPYAAARLRAMLARRPPSTPVVGSEIELYAEIGTHRVHMYLDAIDQDGWIIERKTTSSTIDADYWASIELDYQPALYLAAARGQWPALKGIKYEVARKPGLRPLKANSRREFDETPAEHEARCYEAIGPEYFETREIGIPYDRIERAIEDFHAQCDWLETKPAWRNPQACELCAFRPVCDLSNDTLVKNTPSGFIIRP